MIEWSDEQQMVQAAVRDFIDKEVVPHHRELEHGDLPPYDILRKLFSTFGMDAMARDRFERQIARDKAADAAGGQIDEPAAAAPRDPAEAANAAAFQMIPIIELCRWSPGMVTAMGVSMGLTSAAILSRGTTAQKERWALPLLTLEKIGAWAITEPGSGSDAFGSMRSTARRDGDEYVLNGSKTFITNGPYADTIVFICKLDEGNPPDERKVVSFVLDSGMPGLEQSKPLKKMGMHSSPTGELFLTDVRVGRDRLIGETEHARGRRVARRPRPRSCRSARASPPWRWASSRSASTCRWPTPGTGCSSASRSASSSSSRTSWPAWRWPGSTSRTWCSG